MCIRQVGTRQQQLFNNQLTFFFSCAFNNIQRRVFSVAA